MFKVAYIFSCLFLGFQLEVGYLHKYSAVVTESTGYHGSDSTRSTRVTIFDINDDNVMNDLVSYLKVKCDCSC